MRYSVEVMLSDDSTGKVLELHKVPSDTLKEAEVMYESANQALMEAQETIQERKEGK